MSFATSAIRGIRRQGGETWRRPAQKCRQRRLWLIGFVALGLGAGPCGFAEPALQPIIPEAIVRVVIPPVDRKTAAFDAMAVDQERHRLFLADKLDQGVDVFDISVVPGRYLLTVKVGALPAGLEYAPQIHRLYAGLDDSTVAVIDADVASAQPYTLLDKISTKGVGAADLVGYDANDNKLYVTNPDDGFVSAIDSKTNTVVAQITDLGFTEQPVYDSANGMVYIPSADNNSIIQVDPHTDKVVQRWDIPVVCIPHGLAINPANNQGVIGCSDKDNLVTVVWDFSANRMVRTTDLAGGGDGVVFDAKAQHFFFAAKSFVPPVMAIFNADPIVFLTSVPTSHNSHGVAYDEAHQLIYTYDGKHLEAALWTFPDPISGCFGHEGQLAASGAPREQTPHCRPGRSMPVPGT
jgi:YVTN family beta-propeller protein